jgi:hypothetical protein
LTHIYAFYQLEETFKHCIEAGCPLLISKADNSALSISLSKNNVMLVDIIITYAS